MSVSCETEAVRPRPLSGGLWTLFSWLRRDERSSSSESLSSAGSDRTAASFAFLAPALYRPGTSGPAHLPLPPPTDSYNRRVRDRNLRRQHERDITLHRKYGLYGFGYDVTSLPNSRRGGCERDRRAASESPREHVPGKRRAPPPPIHATFARSRARKRPAPPPPVHLPHITEQKEQEPSNINNETPMSRSSLSDDRPAESRDAAEDTTGCKPEKYSKKDARSKETKDVKMRHEKNFLKQIFDSRKRNSAIETASVKLLPNISELDKQAAEIIEKYRLKEMTRNDKDTGKRDSPESSKLQMEAWICTICLRKYNSTVITCNYCLPLNKANDSYRSSKLTNHSTQTNELPESSRGKPEDKEKLKEMLKEMKDSLPKKPKNDNITRKKSNDDYTKIVEAPTLRIGSSILIGERNPVTQNSKTSVLDKYTSSSQIVSQDHRKNQIDKNNDSKSLAGSEKKEPLSELPSQNIQKEISPSPVSFSENSAGLAPISKLGQIENKKQPTLINSVLITQPVVLVHTRENVVANKSNENKEQVEKINKANEPKPLVIQAKANHDLNTPLKISSLFNPIYIPKSTAVIMQSSAQQTENNITKKSTNNVLVSPNVAQNLKSPEPSVPIVAATTSNSQIKEVQQRSELKIKVDNEQALPSDKVTANAVVTKAPTVIEKTENDVVTTLPTSGDKPEIRLDQHTRRRELINQLERSIAKGDEQAAAEAAVKLAQLRLSCSVLSFSSQIVAEASTSSAPQQSKADSGNKTTRKVEEKIEKPPQIKTEKVELKQITEPNVVLNKNKESVENNERALSTNKSVTNIEPGKNFATSESSNSKSTNEIKKNHNIDQKPLQCEASTSKAIPKKENNSENVPILIWVEDKEATRGPVQFHVRRDAVMGELRKQAEQSLGLAAGMQRWIVGRSLCTDDNTPLVTLAGTALSAPFYLCLVESEAKDITKLNKDLKLNDDAGNVYNELVKLEHQAIVPNSEVFECGVCIEECLPGRGVVLRECVHSFCKECLTDVVRHSEEPVVACPGMGCRGVIQEREIRGLVSHQEYEKWLARGLAAAESGTRNAFHCRTRDCRGWALCDPGVRKFPCPVCKHTNCVPCQAIHERETCEQHRAKLQQSANSPDAGNSNTDEGTRAFLDTLISRGEALECPECSAIIMKKWGCDWVKCSACKTEICWVTKGRRWGPAGRGDTSAGCRCGVDGKRCHPSCGYCH